MTDYTNDIKRYLKGEMTPAERHAFENLALSDPFLAEALEGAEQLSPEAFLDDAEKLTKRLKETHSDLQEEEKSAFHISKTKPFKKTISVRRWSARIAAGLALILVSAYFIRQLNQSIEEETPLAMESSPTINPEKPEDSTFTKDVDSVDGLGETSQATKSKSGSANQPAKEPLTTIAKTDKLESVDVDENKPSPTVTDEKVRIEQLTAATESAKAEDKTINALKAEGAAKKLAGPASRISILPPNVVRGKVTAQEDGSALPGVNVFIKGSKLGTITDSNGMYQLESAGPTPTLVFSFIGLKTTEMKVEEGKEGNVQLSLDDTQLSEVVVVGYGASSSEQSAPVIELAQPLTGNRAFKQYLEKSIVYPEEAKTKRIEGRVTVDFFVETDGSLTNFTIVRGIGAGCDEELIRLIKVGPSWTPTKKDGVPVRDKARVRLKFDLPD